VDVDCDEDVGSKIYPLRFHFRPKGNLNLDLNICKDKWIGQNST
jgi:hypothetical protein